MKKAAVLGWPISHSLSPRLHGYWIAQYGLNASYEAIAVEPHGLKDTLKQLRDDGYAGFNLTIPHKESVIQYLDEIDEVARVIGAVNTVVVREGKLLGTNTDAFGFIENIKQAAPLNKKNKAVVLGAGGAARAICRALVDHGFSSIVLTNRSISKAEQLASSQPGTIETCPWEVRSEALASADLLVNTTSLGMAGKDALDIDLSLLPKSAIVNDIVYVPLETPLLAAAKARGNIAVDGLGMLLYQAVPAFEAWFGVRPEVTQALSAHILEKV